MTNAPGHGRGRSRWSGSSGRLSAGSVSDGTRLPERCAIPGQGGGRISGGRSYHCIRTYTGVGESSRVPFPSCPQ
jgi:hypothetical protein